MAPIGAVDRQQHVARSRPTRWTADNDDIGIAERGPSESSGMMKAAAAEITGRAAVMRAGVTAAFQARMKAARRSGMTKEQIAATVLAIQQEMQAAVQAIGEQAGAAIAGAMASIAGAQRGKSKGGKKGKRPPKPTH